VLSLSTSLFQRTKIYSVGTSAFERDNIYEILQHKFPDASSPLGEGQQRMPCQ